MTERLKSCVDFLQSIFKPRILVLATPDVEQIVARNGLTFAELLAPFSSVHSSTYLKDPLNQTLNIDVVKLKFVDSSDVLPDGAASKRILGDSVSAFSGFDDCDKLYTPTPITPSVDTPWFESWRGLFLDVVPSGDHEFLDQYVGLLFVISWRDSPHESVSNLYRRLHQEIKCKTLFSLPLNYYVVVHDVASGDPAQAEKKCEMLRSHHGYGSASVVKLNSAKDGDDSSKRVRPELWSHVLARKKAFEKPKPKNWPRTPVEEEEIAGSLPCIDATGMSGLSSGLSSPAEYATEASLTLSSSAESTPNFQAVTMHPLSPDAPSGNFLGLTNDGSVVVNEDFLPTPTAGDMYEEDCMNSVQMDPGQWLTNSDLESIRAVLQHYVSKALIPYVERQMKILHEAVGSRKGIHRSIVTATKKWFTPAAKITPGSQSNSVLYGQDAPELQIRKLGDLCFLFRHYDLAFQAYHNAKREFDSDQAWLHMAGALEMAALSAFLHATIQSQGNPTPDTYKQMPQRYFDMAISSYLNVCKLPDYAARTALLSTECLKARGLWADAALTYIRLSGEDSDLRSALFLEQAALCFLRCSPPSERKFGFHMVLAGHRFYKSGQKRHTVRAYCHALQVYRMKGWQLAEDHINYTIGRQARFLNQPSMALAALSALVTSTSGQKPAQQDAFLREFLLALQRSVDGPTVDPSSLPVLPLPILEGNKSQVLVPGVVVEKNVVCGFGAVPATGVSFTDDISKNPIWFRLEEVLVEGLQKENPGPIVPVIFKPTLQRFCDGADNSGGPGAYVGEPLFVELTLKNPLEISVALNDVQLLCDFVQKDEPGDGNQNVVQSDFVPSMMMEPLGETKLNLSITVMAEGELNVTGMSYKLRCSSAEKTAEAEGLVMSAGPAGDDSDVIFAVGRQELRVQGPRLNNSKLERCSVIYGVDRRFSIKVHPPAPSLTCRFVGLPRRMLRNEVRSCVVCLTNSGERPITRVSLCLKDPQCFVVGSSRVFPDSEDSQELQSFMSSFVEPSSPLFGDTEDEEKENSRQLTDGLHRIGTWKEPKRPYVVGLLNGGQLKAGELLVVPLWIRAPCVSGSWSSEALFAYEVEGGFGGKNKRHRVLRHAFDMEVAPSVSLTGSVHRCPRLVGETASDKTDAFNVVLETKNDCRVSGNLSEASEAFREATLVQFSAVSSCVRLTRSATQGMVKLKPQEKHHFFLEADKLQEARNGLVVPGYHADLTMSSLPLDVENKDAKAALSSPVVNFAVKSAWGRLEDDVLKPIYPDHCETSLQGVASSVDGNGSSATPSSFRGPRITQLLSEEEERERSRGPPPLLRVLCLWKSVVKEPDGNERVAWGFSTVPLVMKDRDGVSMTEVRRRSLSLGLSTADSGRFMSVGLDFGNLLKCRYTHPSEQPHDFRKQRVCILEVTLFVQNCTPVDVCLTIDASNDGGRDQAGNLTVLPRPSNAFVLVGRRLKRGLQLQPGELSSPMTLKAAFTRPGAYNLAHLPPLLGVTVAGSDEERWVRAVIPESLLVVRSV